MQTSLILRRPRRDNIMRYAAWSRQQDAYAQCINLQRRTRHEIVASHFTAAALLGVPLPVKRQTLFVAVRYKEQRLRLKNVSCRYWSNADTPGSVVEISGITCVSPEALFIQMSMELTLKQLIMLGDSLICRDQKLALTTIPQIRSFIARCNRFRGLRKCLRALRLMRTRTDSPQETNVRLQILQHGLPEPRVNVQVGNNFIDLAYPAVRIGIEYDGQHHLQQIDSDHERVNHIQSTGWRIFVIDKFILDSSARFTVFLSDIIEAINGVSESKLDLSLARAAVTVHKIADGRRRRVFLG